MKVYQSILPQSTPLQAATVGTSEFNWLSKDSWEEDHKVYVARTLRYPPLGIYAPSPFRRCDRYESAPRALTEWVLLDRTKQPIGIACATIRPGSFYELTLSVIGESFSSPSAATPLSYLVTSLLLQLPVDRILMTSQFALPPALQLAGTIRQVLSPWRGDAALLAISPLQTLQLLEITPAAWWESPLGMTAKKALHFIEKRLERKAQELQFTSKKKRPRFGLVSRLLRWQ